MGQTEQFYEQKIKADAFFADHPQQPTDFIFCRALHRIAICAFKMAPIQSVIGLEVSDNRFDGLAPLE